MKKIFGLIIICIMASACNAKGEEVVCTVDSKEAIFTLNEGIITSYKLDGKKISSAEVTEINGEYFTSAKNNEEGKEALNTYISSIGGMCN